MSSHMFVKFDTIKGECDEYGHPGWCEITNLEQDISNKTSPLPIDAQTGPGAKKCEHGEIKISKVVDKASTGLMEACWEGTTLDSVVIECFRAGEGLNDPQNKAYKDPPIKYFSIELKRVIIREFEYSASANELISEDLELVYAEATYEYQRMSKKSGTVTATRAGRESVTVGAGNWKD